MFFQQIRQNIPEYFIGGSLVLVILAECWKSLELNTPIPYQVFMFWGMLHFVKGVDGPKKFS